MGWADDMYEKGYTHTHGGLMGDNSDYDDKSSLTPSKFEKERKEKERKEKAYLEIITIPDAELSKLYLSRVIDYKITEPFGWKQSGFWSHETHVSLKLEGIGWVPLAPIPPSKYRTNDNTEIYWEWYSVILKELRYSDKENKHVFSLSHLKGKLIFCTIDNNQGKLCFDQIFSVDVESDFERQINDRKNKDKHCFCINLPIISLLENNLFINQPRARQDSIEKDGLKVYQSKKAGLFFIQTNNKQTLFFREMEKNDILSHQNIEFLKPLMQSEGYYFKSGRYFETICTGIRKSRIVNFDKVGNDIKRRLLRNFVKLESSDEYKMLEVGESYLKISSHY